MSFYQFKHSRITLYDSETFFRDSVLNTRGLTIYAKVIKLQELLSQHERV